MLEKDAVMTDMELISRQAREIAELQDRVTAYEQSARRIHMMLVCIGGPLNDNKLHYTPEQLVVFAKIEDEVKP